MAGVWVFVASGRLVMTGAFGATVSAVTVTDDDALLTFVPASVAVAVYVWLASKNVMTA